MTKIHALQLTDTHFQADPNAEIDGIRIDECLTRLIEKSQQTAEQIDLVILSGDLADDQDLATFPKIYARLSQILSRYFSRDIPLLAVPGNHDLHAPLIAEFCRDASVQTTGLTRGEWHFILVNSSVEGQTGGWLAESELANIKGQLEQNAHIANIALIMHHPPVPIGSAWLDTMQISNSPTLFEMLAEYSNVRACIWGHVHQSFDQCSNAIRQLGSPAVYPRQFLPGATAFAVDEEQTSGCRLLHFHNNGKIETQVLRL